MLKRFIRYYKPYKKLFILDLLAAFLVSACDLFYPMITRNIINDVIPNKQIKLLFVFAIVLTLIYTLKYLIISDLYYRKFIPYKLFKLSILCVVVVESSTSFST